MSALSTAGSSTSRRTDWLALVCLLVACKSKAENKFEEARPAEDRGPAVTRMARGERAAEQGAAESAPGGIGEGGLLRPKHLSDEPAAGPAAAGIECEKAISNALIGRDLPDGTPQWGGPHENGAGIFVTSCRLVDQALKGGTVVRYKCGGAFSKEAHGELPCVIEIDELGEGQVADRAAFLADLEAALPNARR